MLSSAREASDIFCPILNKFGISRRFLWTSQVGNFMEIRPVGAAPIHADGRTDGQKERQLNMTKITDAFCDFANAHKTEENRTVSCSYLKDKI